MGSQLAGSKTAFGEPTIAVDTHIFRVGNRTGLAPGKTVLAVEKSLEKNTPQPFRVGAHHWLILHGRYICKARTPECWRCPVVDLCRFRPKTPPPKVDALLLTALALLWPAAAPPYPVHTLVDQAVAAARARLPATAAFVNAVLRRFLREREARVAAACAALSRARSRPNSASLLGSKVLANAGAVLPRMFLRRSVWALLGSFLTKSILHQD